MTVAAAVGVSDDPIAVVSRRRAPIMYVVDAAGRVVLGPAGETALCAELQAIVVSDLARRAGADAGRVALTAAGELVRLVPLDGRDGAHFAVFVEPNATRSPIDEAARRYDLSEREKDIVRELLRGASTAEIAERLYISHSTVATHVRNIGAKMKASKRKEMLAAILGAR